MGYTLGLGDYQKPRQVWNTQLTHCPNLLSAGSAGMHHLCLIDDKRFYKISKNLSLKKKDSQAEQSTPVILTLGRQRQVDHTKTKSSLGYRVSPGPPPLYAR